MSDANIAGARTKYERISELSGRHTLEITKNAAGWAGFLATAAAMYKYPWADQVMIHAQRPDAAACADMRVWNETFGRYVKKGAGGIALIDRSSHTPRLRYVFDISDTVEAANIQRQTRKPYVWRMWPHHAPAAREMLRYVYGGDMMKSTREQIAGAIDSLMDEGNGASEEHRRLVASSALYAVLTRCGINPGDMSADFRAISEYGTVAKAAELGNEIAGLSEEILRQIELAVKKYEREKALAQRSDERGERTDISSRGRLPDSRPGDGRSGGSEQDPGQIRPDEALVPGELPEGAVRDASAQGGTLEPSGGSGRNGQPEIEIDHDGDAGERPAPGQGERPDGLGEAHEHDEGPGGGNDPGTDIRVNPETGEEPGAPEPRAPVYAIGDSVYLEDDRRYIIESIGSFDIHLIDTSLSFPIGRAISKGQFEYLFERNPLNFAGLTEETPAISDTADPFEEEQRPASDGRPRQLELFSEEEQISFIKEDKSLLTDGDIDFALTRAKPNYGSERRITLICLEYAKPRDMANSLKNEFGVGGMSVKYPDGTSGWMQYGPSGLSINKGESGRTRLSWANVRDRYIKLVTSGRYGKEFAPSIFGQNPGDTPAARPNEEKEISELENIHADEVISGPETASQNEADGAETPPIDYRIPDQARDYGGPKTRFRNNAEAIRTLKAIETENRPATADEQEVLSRFIGWGGIPQAFDGNNDDWRAEYGELRELLTDEEYESARASTLNAYYTSPTIIKAIYKALGDMGFEGGRMLEPAAGIGNFFGLLPEEMKNSELHGVELDGVSGRIARQLYQTANIQITGFEKTGFPENYFDIAVGNVPFGGYKLSDRRYDGNNFLVHDYFFAKSLDLVRPGGVVAFVTSQGTMDKENPSVRKYLAGRAELMGAIRLPNDAFKENAGTEVTTDIIFLRKRERVIDAEPEWIHLGVNSEGIRLNSYFAEHPEMILGRMVYGNKLYGKEEGTSCVPFGEDEAKDLSELLEGAIGGIQGRIMDYGVSGNDGEKKPDWLPADPNVKNWSFTLVGGEIYYQTDTQMTREELPEPDKDRMKSLLELETCVKSLISIQQRDYPDGVIREQQAELNALYDDFTSQYGLINNRANARLFDRDSAYYLLCSLEILDENGGLERKADMFDKRTIRRHTAPESADTPLEALAVSLAEKGRVDLGYMSQLTGMEREEIIGGLKGIIYPNPARKDANENYIYETSEEYLSGNVRRKLAIARQYADTQPEMFAGNVTALEEAQPSRLNAGDIGVRLGAVWVDVKYVQDFVHELLNTPRGIRSYVNVEYSSHTCEWNISGKDYYGGSVEAGVTWGTKRMNAYRIIENTLNQREVRIFDNVERDGREVRELNKKETALVQMRQEAIKEAFANWIFKDPERREYLVGKYNELFNSTRPREYDGSHLTFTGMNPEISLRKHQTDAIAHILYGGNTLLAHEVGAGKSYEMTAAAMESKRLGLCDKNLFVVPNHLTEQMASEFLRLYPAANILVATKKDFETANRKKFCARIATGDYDAIIIGHSQFEKIPISEERQRKLIKEQIRDISWALREAKESKGENFTVKQMEKLKKSLEARLAKLNDGARKDDVICFEDLGIDRLFVDESQGYKNLFLYTKMRNVAGIPQSEAKKSSDMYMKCRYMDERTKGRGIVFASGTPVSNSMTELFTLMRYLQHDKLKDMSLEHFDAWASTFGDTTTSVELSPEGSGYRSRTRFAKFYNLPELMSVFKESADIKTADILNLPRPEAEFHNVAVKPTETQKKLVQELAVRAEKVHKRLVDPRDDNMLAIVTDGRKTGLDQRLIDPSYPDEPGTKVNACMENVYRIWDGTKQDRLTQLLFCDFSTPGKDKFNVYDDIKNKLVGKGVPDREIAYIHDADSEMKKKELFAKVRNGSVRILMGSTQKMGSGTNVQDRLIALHDLDCPWRPSDLQQRAGRIIRQGNRNENVHIYRYVTESTFDSYSYQTLECKQKFISQIMTSKSPARSCEDVDESVLSYAEVKALCAGNPLIKEKMELDVQVSKLRMAKSEHQHNVYELQDRLKTRFPAYIQHTEGYIESLKRDGDISAKTKDAKEFPGMTVMGKTYAGREEAAKALAELCGGMPRGAQLEAGEYRGFKIMVKSSELRGTTELTLKGESSHVVYLGDSAAGNITRMNNTLDGIEEKIAEQNSRLDDLRSQVKAAKEEIYRPFPHEAELERKLERLNELNIKLNLDGRLEGEEMPDAAGEPPRVEEEAAKAAQDERDSLICNARQKLGANAIITDAQRGRTYYGNILEAGAEYAVQKISRAQGVVHSFSKAQGLRDAIETGGSEKISVAYGKDGGCAVEPAKSGRDREEAAVSY